MSSTVVYAGVVSAGAEKGSTDGDAGVGSTGGDAGVGSTSVDAGSTVAPVMMQKG